MFSDLRLSLRSLARNRSFAAIAVLTLAVGIGASATMFGTLRALVLAPFDYPASDRLAMVWSGNGWPLSPADFLDLHEQSTSFEAFGVYSPAPFNVGHEKAQAVSGANVTAGVLRAFGVTPARGRLFEPADDLPGAAPVAIIGHALWQETFGGDPDLVGRTIRLNGGDVTLVGIMPAGFEFVGPWLRTTDSQVWMPLSPPLVEQRGSRGSHWLCGLARLRPGVAVEAADAEIKTIGRRLTELYPDSNTRKAFLVRSLHDEMTSQTGSQVWVLFGAVVLVLLVACANVASMLLARGARRSGEFAVRVALGATRGVMVRLALAESALLAAAGALAGLVFAFGGIAVMRVIAPVTEARQAAIALDGPVLLFALGATVLTALLAGLPPALAAMRTGLAGVMRTDARGAVGSHSRHRMLRTLLIAQVAVAFVLANGAVLFSHGYLKLLRENRLLATDYVLTARVYLRGDRYKEEADRIRFWDQFVERLGALPGVSAAGFTTKLPLQGGSNTSVLVNDEVYDTAQQRMLVERSSVTPGYFEAIGLRLVKGRNLGPEDREGEIRGVIVNRAMVAKAWPDKEPLGELIRNNNSGQPEWTYRVVGVVEDVRQWSARAAVQPEMYLTPEGHWGRAISVVLRSPQPATALAPMLGRELAALDTELALGSIRTLNQVVARSTASDRAMAGLVNFFMAAALGLVAVGLYGTLSYTVQQRTREIGVRMAVGALGRDILRLVFAQGGRWVAIGVLCGIAGTFASVRLFKSLVYEMEGVTALPLLLAAAAVGLAATLACWLPARRAAKLDPLVALRTD